MCLGCGILNLSQTEVLAAHPMVLLRTLFEKVDVFVDVTAHFVDADALLDPHAFMYASEVGIVKCRIASRVRDQDQFTAPFQLLLKPQILIVPTIGHETIAAVSTTLFQNVDDKTKHGDF